VFQNTSSAATLSMTSAGLPFERHRTPLRARAKAVKAAHYSFNLLAYTPAISRHSSLHPDGEGGKRDASCKQASTPVSKMLQVQTGQRAFVVQSQRIEASYGTAIGFRSSYIILARRRTGRSCCRPNGLQHNEGDSGGLQQNKGDTASTRACGAYTRQCWSGTGIATLS